MVTEAEQRPIIGVTARSVGARVTGWRWGAHAVPSAYLAAIESAGGTPVVLPSPILERDARAGGRQALPIDGLVLTGGDDVDPSLYGQTAHPRTYGTNLTADRWELELVMDAVEHRVPILAICRGLQVLNIARGGTLLQHLESDDHGVPGPDGSGTSHMVTVVPATMLAAVLGGAHRASAICHHHQAVDALGVGLTVAARAADGTIEALEDPRHKVLAVQWHPEEDASTLESSRRLFEWLIREASIQAPQQPSSIAW